MEKMTPEQLAQAVRDEQMTFEDAMLHHLVFSHSVVVPDIELYLTLVLAIGWAKLDRWDEIIDLPTGPASVAEIVERYQLGAFLD
jgi:hypothetical protein